MLVPKGWECMLKRTAYIEPIGLAFQELHSMLQLSAGVQVGQYVRNPALDANTEFQDE